jgi:hypothetical protein
MSKIKTLNASLSVAEEFKHLAHGFLTTQELLQVNDEVEKLNMDKIFEENLDNSEIESFVNDTAEAVAQSESSILEVYEKYKKRGATRSQLADAIMEAGSFLYGHKEVIGFVLVYLNKRGKLKNLRKKHKWIDAFMKALDE